MKKQWAVTVWYEGDGETITVFGKDKTDAIKSAIKVVECKKQMPGQYREAISVTVNSEVSDGMP